LLELPARVLSWALAVSFNERCTTSLARARLSEILSWKEGLKLVRLLMESHRLPCRHLCHPLSHVVH